ncbi:hypothetical protein M426DRAFT_323117 [Hypoxylon sp. CI-4A]|nr:hypothetical protein M426DRAFT_323117 [Hypoxylon sp. CI-4A]
MDDQFNGRTDDDLFADDFEPVEVQEETAAPKTVHQSPPLETDNQAPSVTPTEPVASAKPTPSFNALASLAQSRHANAKPTSAPAPSHHHPKQRKHSPKPVATPTTPTTTESQEQQETNNKGSNHNGDTSKKPQVPTVRPGQNTALVDRLASGQNPRTKLTDSELADKMDKMRILAAEKTRQFEEAERDSRSHALAYEKGMEQTRKRRAEEAERRRRGQEERRRMDEERAANRERKLKAMGMKDGASWDEGKDVQEEGDKRGFRGANGGIRGARSNVNVGLGGSRFADKDDSPPAPREFHPDDFRGRGRGGRGRGSTRGGRGGRGGFNHDGEKRDGNKPAQNGNTPSQQKPKQPPPTADDFPALPAAKKSDPMINKPDLMDTSAFSPAPIGKWDDEMAALDA